MRITCPPHTRLQDYLLSQGIHILTAFGGRGNCGKCVVKVIRGNAAINTMDRMWFSTEQLEQGYRLGCQAYAKDEALEVDIDRVSFLGSHSPRRND